MDFLKAKFKGQNGRKNKLIKLLDLMSSEDVKVFKNENTIEVCFFIEHKSILAIGEKMNEINENAYMNGYNWEAFLKSYLEQKNPELLEEMETDPEAGTYVAYYKLTKENEDKAEKFSKLIQSLIENNEKIYTFLRENGNEIQWD